MSNHPGEHTMALLHRETKLLIFLAIIAIISNTIPFYMLLNYGRP